MNTFVQRPSYEKEFNYYRRLCNELGKDLQRVQDDRDRLTREVRRLQAQNRLDRDLAHLAGFAPDIATLAVRVLDAVVEHSLCSRALILREEPPGGGRFSVLATAGCRDILLKASVTVENAPTYGYSFDGNHFPSDKPAVFKTFNKLLGPGSLIWNYDSETGFAVLLTGAVGPADTMFQQQGDDLTSIALNRIIDGVWRIRGRQQGADICGTVAANTPTQQGGTSNGATDPMPDISCATIREHEIVGGLEKGGSIEDIVAVVREDNEYLLFVRPSWGNGFRQVRTYRGRSEKAYKDFTRLIAYARSACKYDKQLAVFATNSPQSIVLRAAVRSPRSITNDGADLAKGADLPSATPHRVGTSTERS